jgi:hypothetical protein
VITRLRFHILDRLGPDTQHIVARACDINPGALSNYCTGAKPIPYHHLARLSRCLEVPGPDLLGYTDLDEIPG